MRELRKPNICLLPMKNYIRIFLLGLSVCTLFSCERSEEPNSSLVPEGEYQRAIGEFDMQEPVRTYLAIRDLLSEGSIQSASQMTTDSSQFIDTMNRYLQRIGDKKFRENHSRVRDRLILHSVHHEEDQSLLVLETANVKAAVFFHRTETGFLEIEVGGPVKVNSALNRKFYIAKGEPDAVLAE